MLLLEVTNLDCSVKDSSFLRTRTRSLLNGVSIGIEEGQSLALIGKSGSGKTTLARCITGILAPTAGTIRFAGTCIHPEIRNRKSVGLDIQMLFQNAGASLNPMLTVESVVMEGLGARGQAKTKSEQTRMAGDLLSSVDLTSDVLRCLPNQLSGGERQRVALARTLAVKPRLLILDEPTSALDSLTGKTLHALLKSLQRQFDFALLYITHDMRAAFAVCDRVAVMHAGKIVEEGTARDIIASPKSDHTMTLLRRYERKLM